MASLGALRPVSPELPLCCALDVGQLAPLRPQPCLKGALQGILVCADSGPHCLDAAAAANLWGQTGRADEVCCSASATASSKTLACAPANHTGCPKLQQ